MNKELHEELVRTEIYKLIEEYKIVGELIGVANPKDINEHYLFINKDDVADLSLQIYIIVLREIRKYGGKL